MDRMRVGLVFLVCAPLTCFSVSCGTKEQDKGVEGEGLSAADSAPDTNPDGVPYPTDNIGTSPRLGNRRGNRMQNFKFLGYPNGDKSQGLQPISLAQYYDPDALNYKVIRIVASGVWCPPCQAEAQMVAPLKPQFVKKKVAWLVSLSEGGTPGISSTQKDLDGWLAEFKLPYTQWLDPANKKLGVFYDRAAIPWNCTLNAKTMEILESTTGAPRSETELMAELDDWITKIDSGSFNWPAQ
jgi:hypothetical protein